MKVQIFDVEHGACALVTADTGARLLIDCGHNSSTGWRPSTHLPAMGVSALDYLLVTNKDEDHVSDLPRLRKAVNIRTLYRNPTLTPTALQSIKAEGGIDVGIAELIAMLQLYTGQAIDLGGLSFKAFWNRYPSDFDDTNNLSVVNFLHYYGLHVVFPGDIEIAGWRKLMERPDSSASWFRSMSSWRLTMAAPTAAAKNCSTSAGGRRS